MSGHSKWSQIKRKKGEKDAAKGKLVGSHADDLDVRIAAQLLVKQRAKQR